ncbi:MAG: PAS domain S-box protein [Methylacidiphilales bacterium]|nr:PAS domain S-box protein [Candidatus Methylacidiphilales bacterium]
MNAAERSQIPLWQKAALLGMGYFLCAEASIYLYVPGGPFIPIWLPAGLYVAVLLLNQPRDWLWLALAVLPANLLFDLLHGTKLVVILVFYCANTSEAVIGALLVRRFVAERPTLATLKEFMGLLGFSVVLSTMLGATFCAAMLTVLDSGTSFAQSWINWWTGEAMAILLFSSFILTWFSIPRGTYLYFLNQRGKLVEAILLAVVSITLTWHLLHLSQGIMTANTSEMLLPLLWAGLRFGPRGATAANLLLALPMAFFTSQFSAGLTPEQVSSGEYLFNLQFSLAVASLVGLIPAIVLHTHRKTMEELHESEDRFRNLTAAAFEGIFITENGRVIDMNDQGLKMFGYERSEMIGREAGDFVSPETRSIVMEAIRAEMETCYEHQLVRKDGRLFQAEAQAKMVHVGNRKLRMTAIRDITERKHAEEQIAEQAALLDQARDAIVVCDLKGIILFWSKGAERIYGWTHEEAMGRHVGQLIYLDPGKFEAVDQLFLSLGEWSGEFQHLTKDRRALTIEARWTLVRDKEGRPKSVLAINTDITEKKKIEAQFMRAQRMESLGTLAGGIAHDLNNILAPIMMSIEILKRTATDPQAQSILKTIEVSSKRGADIVRQVLSFARGLEGERIEVQPKDLLNDIETIIKDTFPKNIQLQLSLPEESWKISGDATQLHQILLNLCLNARDAMPHGGKLNLRLENTVLDQQPAALHLQAKTGRYVIINVIDSGTGIPPAILDKIFEPFFTTKEVGKGTGLGLSTVLAIVKSHGGFVNVSSEPAGGTTFKIYLPAMAASSEARKDVTALPGLLLGKGETVLIVDDEASVLTVTSQTLEAFGYQTLMATNGEEAIAIYAQHQGEIAVVLTDMAMPVMDGTATIRALRKINPAIKIIVVSGSASSGSATKIFDPGIKHFLAKPYTTETLLKTLQATLDET